MNQHIEVFVTGFFFPVELAGVPSSLRSLGDPCGPVLQIENNHHAIISNVCS